MRTYLIEFVIAIGPALAGGIARYVHDVSKMGGDFNGKRFLAQIIMAAFVGWVTLSALMNVDYFIANPTLLGSIVGVSSFLSPNILDLLEQYIPQKLEKKLKKL